MSLLLSKQNILSVCVRSSFHDSQLSTAFTRILIGLHMTKSSNWQADTTNKT